MKPWPPSSCSAFGVTNIEASTHSTNAAALASSPGRPRSRRDAASQTRSRAASTAAAMSAMQEGERLVMRDGSAERDPLAGVAARVLRRLSQHAHDPGRGLDPREGKGAPRAGSADPLRHDGSRLDAERRSAGCAQARAADGLADDAARAARSCARAPGPPADRAGRREPRAARRGPCLASVWIRGAVSKTSAARIPGAASSGWARLRSAASPPSSRSP